MFCFVFITWFIKFITQFLFLFLVWFPPSSSSFLSHFCFLLFCFTFRFAVILFLFYFFKCFNFIWLLHHPHLASGSSTSTHSEVLCIIRKRICIYLLTYMITMIPSSFSFTKCKRLTHWLTDWLASTTPAAPGTRMRVPMRDQDQDRDARSPGLAALCSQLHALTAEMRFELSLIYVRFKL